MIQKNLSGITILSGKSILQFEKFLRQIPCEPSLCGKTTFLTSEWPFQTGYTVQLLLVISKDAWSLNANEHEILHEQ